MRAFMHIFQMCCSSQLLTLGGDIEGEGILVDRHPVLSLGDESESEAELGELLPAPVDFEPKVLVAP